MRWPMPPFTRRSFTWVLLVAPMACIGCSEESVSPNVKAGEKRRQMIEEDLQKRADLSSRKPETRELPRLTRENRRSAQSMAAARSISWTLAPITT